MGFTIGLDMSNESLTYKYYSNDCKKLLDLSPRLFAIQNCIFEEPTTSLSCMNPWSDNQLPRRLSQNSGIFPPTRQLLLYTPMCEVNSN